MIGPKNDAVLLEPAGVRREMNNRRPSCVWSRLALLVLS
jgi:hypothetical protein